MDSKNPHTVAGAGVVCDNLAAITTASSSATAVTPVSLSTITDAVTILENTLRHIVALADGAAHALEAWTSHDPVERRAMGQADSFIHLIQDLLETGLKQADRIEDDLIAMTGGSNA